MKFSESILKWKYQMMKNESVQIEVINQHGSSPVYLYSHSDALSMVSTIYNILSQKKRWDDADYLARMIFCAMIPENKWFEEKGYAIGTTLYDELALFISLNVPKQTIKIQITSDLYNYQEMSFEDFVNKFYNSASL